MVAPTGQRVETTTTITKDDDDDASKRTLLCRPSEFAYFTMARETYAEYFMCPLFVRTLHDSLAAQCMSVAAYVVGGEW